MPTIYLDEADAERVGFSKIKIVSSMGGGERTYRLQGFKGRKLIQDVGFGRIVNTKGQGSKWSNYLFTWTVGDDHDGDYAETLREAKKYLSSLLTELIQNQYGLKLPIRL